MSTAFKQVLKKKKQADKNEKSLFNDEIPGESMSEDSSANDSSSDEKQQKQKPVK